MFQAVLLGALFPFSYKYLFSACCVWGGGLLGIQWRMRGPGPAPLCDPGAHAQVVVPVRAVLRGGGGIESQI